MLREIADVRQRAGEGEKRWFTSSDLDLFIWFDTAAEIISFHLVYDKQRAEKALIWNKLGALFHLRVDNCSRPGHYPSSPILTDRLPLDKPRLESLLSLQMRNVEPAIGAFVVQKIAAAE